MSAQADASIVLELIGAFRRSKAMFTAVRLGVFDELENRPQTADVLAARLELNAGALCRLLNACVGLSLLRCDGETYRNTDTASRYLVASSPDTLAGYIIYSDQSLYPLWSHLDDAVREGANRWTQTFGSRDALFSHYFRDEASTAAFLGGMHGFGQITSPLVARAFDLQGFTHLVDLGGATGHLANHSRVSISVTREPPSESGLLRAISSKTHYRPAISMRSGALSTTGPSLRSWRYSAKSMTRFRPAAVCSSLRHWWTRIDRVRSIR